MLPIPTEWWLRPVSRACRVGAHSAVVWKRLYLKPLAASRSAVGVWHGPPNALEAPKPTSSSRTIRTFGAPAGGNRGWIAGNVVSGSFASYVVRPGAGRSGIGNIARAWRSGPFVTKVLHPRPCAQVRPCWTPEAPRGSSDRDEPVHVKGEDHQGAIKTPRNISHSR